MKWEREDEEREDFIHEVERDGEYLVVGVGRFVPSV